MRVMKSTEAKRYEPEEGWERMAMAGSEKLSLEWFQKPEGHASPMHDHENEQVCVVLEGELAVITEDSEQVLHADDSAWLDAWESHRVVNTGEGRAVGIDIFSPGRSFDFWLDREDN